MTSPGHGLDGPPPRRRWWGPWGKAIAVAAALGTAFAVGAVVLALATTDPRRTDACVASYAEDGGAAGRIRDALRTVGESGGTAALGDLTGEVPGWDKVYVITTAELDRVGDQFPDDARAVDAWIGCDAMLPYRASFPTASVLFFHRDGRIVRALEVGYHLTADGSSRTVATRGTRVEPAPGCDRAPCLRLVGPSAANP